MTTASRIFWDLTTLLLFRLQRILTADRDAGVPASSSDEIGVSNARALKAVLPAPADVR